MEIWTTFTPRKVSWELTYVKTNGESSSSNWQENIGLIDNSLEKLKDSGIVGIRLVIFPSEITNDGELFDWKLIENMLDLCSKHKLRVDLCIGPFQYPHYPGIYLPSELLKIFSPRGKHIDSDFVFKEFGTRFLKAQIRKFGNDKRIHGFHFANEWPDEQNIEGKRGLRIGVSEKFMQDSARLLKSLTKKPILLNTNIDALDHRRVIKVFGEILEILAKQVKLGFDIYPSQSKWKKVPLQKLRNKVYGYSKSFKSMQNKFPESEMYFAEVEAQPWGGGQSWYQLINEETNPKEKILTYTKSSLNETWSKYIAGTNCQALSLWGSDFWLSADMMGIKWPLEQVSCLLDSLPD